MPLRKVAFWAHLVCGITVGVVVLVMAVTGVLLTYQKQMVQWADREHWTEAAVPGQRVALSELVQAAQAYDPDADVSSVTVHSGPRGPVAASLGDGRTLYLDPSNGAVRGENRTGIRSFFSTVTRVHRWLGASDEQRATARAVTGWSNLVFLFLILSGLYLWIPRRWSWQHLRPILLLKRSAKGKARDFNWHHVGGVWAAIPLALVVASATVISFPWASDLAYRLVGDQAPVRSATGSAAPEEEPAMDFDIEGLDPLMEPALNRVSPWRTVTFAVPDHAGELVQVRIDQGWGGEPQKRHTVRYDAGSGAEVGYETMADQSRGRRLRTFMRFAHTGEYFGVVGQTVAGFVSLVSVILVWSGFALAWRRLVVPVLRRRAMPRTDAAGFQRGARLLGR